MTYAEEHKGFGSNVAPSATKRHWTDPRRGSPDSTRLPAPGDGWKCDECSFDNFGGNKRCGRCAAPPPEGKGNRRIPGRLSGERTQVSFARKTPRVTRGA